MKMNNAYISQKKVFLTFLSTEQFYPDTVRCFLEYIQRSNHFQIINLPKNLYVASEELFENPNPIEPFPLLQLSDGSQHPVIISTKQDNWAMLSLEFDGDYTTKHLLGEDCTQESIAWLVDILSAGSRMMAADYAYISLENETDLTDIFKCEGGKLRLKRIPVMLWITSLIYEDMTSIDSSIWKVQQQWDGAMLLIPKPISIKQQNNVNSINDSINPQELSQNIGAMLTILLNGDTDKLFSAISEQDPEIRRYSVKSLLSNTELNPYISEIMEENIDNIRTISGFGYDTTSIQKETSSGSSHKYSSIFAAIQDVHERRQVLRWIIHDRDVANEHIKAVLRTALEDPDWEVRMTAVIGTARFKLYDLRNRVNKIVLPRTSREGLNATDRKILVTIRKTVVELFNSRKPTENSTLIPNSSESMKAHLMRCVTGHPVTSHEKVFLLILSLIQPVVPCSPEPQNLPLGIVRKMNCYYLGQTEIELVWIPPVKHWLGDELDHQNISNPIRGVIPKTGFFIAKQPVMLRSIQGIRTGSLSGYKLLNDTDYLTCSWPEAQRLCNSLGQIYDLSITLPIADEWEMAARGPDGRRFPWGNGFEQDMHHFASTWGCKDMVGVIGQWTCTLSESSDPIVCGGIDQLRCAERKTASQDSMEIGFRFVVKLQE